MVLLLLLLLRSSARISFCCCKDLAQGFLCKMIFVDDPSTCPPPYAKASLHWRLSQSSHHKHPAGFLHCSDFAPSSPEAAPPMALRSPGLRTPVTGNGNPPHAAIGRNDEGGNDAGGKEAKGLDSELWHACAGGMVQLPSVGAEVIYFPQGHGEQAATPPDFTSSLAPSGTVSCRVLFVSLHADTETDEVYARMGLHPQGKEHPHQHSHPPASAPALPQLEKPASFAKTLTQSDANNGGGFSVPRYCAETIFPRLDYSVDPPVQTILAKDVQGHVWKFRHIYRGTPRRHLLTTGWSTFVNQKKLVAGDAIVFLRGAGGKLYVGVRRSMRGTNGNDTLSWPGGVPTHPRAYADLLAASDAAAAGRPAAMAGSLTNSFARNRARVNAKAVLEAMASAARGEPFEVIYYPRASTAEFCVRSEVVRASLNHSWYPGMRFKMAFETEDSSRISWFMGTISAVHPADPIFWPNSPWRLLQVLWDEPDLLQGVSRVSPWQVELVSTVPIQLPPFSLPKKKFRVTQPFEYQVNESPQGFFGAPKASLATSVLGQINPWHSFSNDVLAGMQGARHEKTFGLTSENQRTRRWPGLTEDFETQEHKNVFIGGTTDLNLGNYDHTAGQKVLQRLTTSAVNSEAESALTTPPRWAEIPTSRCAPFLLFGKAIHLPHAVKEQPQLSGSTSSEGNSCHRSKENSPRTQSSTNSSFVGSRTDSVDQTDGLLHASKPEVDALKPREEGRDSNCTDEIGGLKWYKEHISMMNSEKKEVLGNTSDESKMHCKIFLENEEMGRTVDLSQFQSYEELYDRLAVLFDTDKSKLSARVVYKDLEGSTIHIGGEPYRNFVQTVRKLTILSDPGSNVAP